jgi:hypothetical protein
LAAVRVAAVPEPVLGEGGEDVGDTFVVARAVNLTGGLLTADAAPSDTGVLFLPEPIYQRRPTGTVAAIGAISRTWMTTAKPSGQRRAPPPLPGPGRPAVVETSLGLRPASTRSRA